MFLTKTYEVEDCSRYDKGNSDKTSSYTFEEYVNSGVTQTLSFNTDNYLVDLPKNNTGSCYHIPLLNQSSQKVEISVIAKVSSNSDTAYLNADFGFGLVDTVNHKSNFVYYRGVNGSNKAVKRYSKQTAISTMSHTYNSEVSTNQNNNWLKHSIVVDGLSFTYKVKDISDNTLWEYTNTFDNDLTGKQLGLITGWNNCKIYFKELKVKQL